MITIMKNFNMLKTICFILSVFALHSCNHENKAIAEEEEVLPEDIVELREDQIKLAGIDTGVIELRVMGATLKVNGIVATAPQNIATVCVPLGGFIKSSGLIPGSAVKKGQTLAIIASQDFVDIQQNYLEARNKLEYAEAEFDRHSELYKEDVYSQKNVQQVTAEFKSLKAQVKGLEQKLFLIGINPSNMHEEDISNSFAVVSPITGYVNSVTINLGKYVAPSDVLFEIVNNDNLFLELTLFEKDASSVVSGQKIHFFLNNETEQHEAVIYQTGKSVGDDKTFKVYARVLSVCKNLLPGMYVQAVIETSGNKVASLPSDAIVSFDDKDYIFVFEKNKEEDGKPFTEYRMVQVKKGFSGEGYTEICIPEDFDIENAIVVVKGAYNLLSAKKNAGEMAC
jgi:RND family efflux transporter MFP subunit